MFTQEQLSTSTDAKEMIRGIEEEAWLECARHGRIERVQCFAADAACPVVLRFEASSAAAACVDSMSGRYYDERRLEASLYDGHRKRVMPDDVDIERSVRLGAVVAERRAEQEREAAAVAAAAEAEKERVAAEAAAEALAAGEAAAAEAAAAAARVRLPRHTYVKLVGLVSKPEKNGAVGVVEGVDEGSGRYTVKLREGGALALKLANLLQMAEVRLVGNLGPSRGISDHLGESRGVSGDLGGSRDGRPVEKKHRSNPGFFFQVRLVGLAASMAEHEGATGTIFERNAEAEMYGVELASGQSLPVGYANVRLADGAHGIVDGLQGAAQYNGLVARVLEFEESSGRYLALLDGGKQLRLRPQNLRL